MRKIHGGGDLPLIECINHRKGTHVVRWDKQADGDRGYAYMEEVVDHKPTLAEVKELVRGWIDSQTNERIIGGFRWHDTDIWLSTENQRNFSEAQRRADANADILPLTFKIGEDGDKEPIYHTFTEVAELDDFYNKAFAYINECLEEGWRRKDSVDWSDYENLVSEV